MENSEKTLNCFGFDSKYYDRNYDEIEPYQTEKSGDFTYTRFENKTTQQPIVRITRTSSETKEEWAYGKWEDRASLEYKPINELRRVIETPEPEPEIPHITTVIPFISPSHSGMIADGLNTVVGTCLEGCGWKCYYFDGDEIEGQWVEGIVENGSEISDEEVMMSTLVHGIYKARITATKNGHTETFEGNIYRP